MELRETYTDLTTTAEHVLGQEISLGPEGREIRARHRAGDRGPLPIINIFPAIDRAGALDRSRGMTRTLSAAGRNLSLEILAIAAGRRRRWMTARLARTWREHCGRDAREESSSRAEGRFVRDRGGRVGEKGVATLRSRISLVRRLPGAGPAALRIAHTPSARRGEKERKRERFVKIR